jgi:hypothetical protein
MTTIRNYVAQQGETFTRVTIGKTNPDGDPFDLTDWTFAGQMRQSHTGSLVETFNMSLSGSAMQGALVMQLTAAQMAAVPGGDFDYDVEIYSGSIVRKWQKGIIRVEPEVTK